MKKIQNLNSQNKLKASGFLTETQFKLKCHRLVALLLIKDCFLIKIRIIIFYTLVTLAPISWEVLFDTLGRIKTFPCYEPEYQSLEIVSRWAFWSRLGELDVLGVGKSKKIIYLVLIFHIAILIETKSYSAYSKIPLGIVRLYLSWSKPKKAPQFGHYNFVSIQKASQRSLMVFPKTHSFMNQKTMVLAPRSHQSKTC